MRNCTIALALAGILTLASSAGAQLHLELAEDPIEDPIPPNGSVWHALAPGAVYCSEFTQQNYGDNGDGEVSECDQITLDGIVFHITWAGPTYHLHAVGGEDPPFLDGAAEPEDTLRDATCQYMHWIFPEIVRCQFSHIEEHEDSNSNGIADVGDSFLMEATWWEIVDIGLNIEVVEVPNPTERGTWSKIKAFFGRLLE
jgi:hypothetical protein